MADEVDPVAHSAALDAPQTAVQQLVKREVVAGITLLTFADIIKSAGVSLADFVSDVLVAHRWFFESGDTSWGWAAVTIQAVSGAVSGLMLAWAAFDGDHRTVGWSECKKIAVGLPLGWLGLAKVVTAGLALTTRRHNLAAHHFELEEGGQEELSALELAEELRTLKLLGVAELCLEAAPQALLQAYVGVAYGGFEPGSYDLLLVASLSVSLLAGGMEMLGMEEIRRDPVTQWSAYGMVTVLARSSLLGALIFGGGLTACAFKGYAWMYIVATVVVLICVAYEAIGRSSNPKFGSTLTLLLATVLPPVLFLVVAALYFENGAHAPNNYAAKGEPTWRYTYTYSNGTAEITAHHDFDTLEGLYAKGQTHIPSDRPQDLNAGYGYDFTALAQLPSHDPQRVGRWSTPHSYDCDERLGGIASFAVCAAMFVVCGTASVALDPEWGCSVRCGGQHVADRGLEKLPEQGHERKHIGYSAAQAPAILGLSYKNPMHDELMISK